MNKLLELANYYVRNPSERLVVGEAHPYAYPHCAANKKGPLGHALINPEKWEGILFLFPLIREVKGKTITEYLEIDNAVIWDDSLLKLEYRGYPPALWRALLHFHDHTEYWDEKGLTASGQRYLQETF